MDEAVREAVVECVISSLYEVGPAVQTEEITQAVLTALRDRDTLTYARYALAVKRPRHLADFAKWLIYDHPNRPQDEPNPPIMVSKRNGSVEPFDTRKLIRSIEHAGRNRPMFDTPSSRRLAAEISQRLTGKTSPEPPIRSQYIGEYTLARLKEIDEVAALSYAILFYNLNTIEKINTAINRLVAEPSEEMPGQTS